MQTVALVLALSRRRYTSTSSCWSRCGGRTPRPAVCSGGTTTETAEVTRPLAYNQGFYNLFLTIGTAVGIVLCATDHRGGVGQGTCGRRAGAVALLDLLALALR